MMREQRNALLDMLDNLSQLPSILLRKNNKGEHRRGSVSPFTRSWERRRGWKETEENRNIRVVSHKKGIEEKGSLKKNPHPSKRRSKETQAKGSTNKPFVSENGSNPVTKESSRPTPVRKTRNRPLKTEKTKKPLNKKGAKQVRSKPFNPLRDAKDLDAYINSIIDDL